MKVAIYCRVSTKGKRQDPMTQLTQLRKYAKVRAFEVYREYIDYISGAKERRPELDALREAAKKREFDAILVWRLDRLGRSLGHLISLIEEFHALGIQFISYCENMDTTTSSGKLLFNVVGAIAAFEKDLIKERVRAGLARARSQGKRFGRPKKVASMVEFERLRTIGITIPEIAGRLNISRATAYRVSKTLQTVGGKDQ